MNGQLSVGEWICQDFGRYLKSLVAEGRCVFLSYHVDFLDLRNIGKFVEKHLEFADVNVIHGNNGRGKSTIVRAISSVTGSQVGVNVGRTDVHNTISSIFPDCRYIDLNQG
ncbi:MAG: ATP-binding protein [Euryarchaeota archaeon]|nr:ATP-binding protein [Euryarchaeota archaeon]